MAYSLYILYILKQQLIILIIMSLLLWTPSIFGVSGLLFMGTDRKFSFKINLSKYKMNLFK